MLNVQCSAGHVYCPKPMSQLAERAERHALEGKTGILTIRPDDCEECRRVRAQNARLAFQIAS